MVLVGAFAGMTGLVSMESIQAAVKERFGGKIGDLNAKAVEKAYQAAQEAK
ncbi:MAG TPA: 2-oxoacid:acceptor oxidoreductase family protein [Phycisphaerae bacterium]|nr:2-oxoacid:acceptor oxidoreductase family protein [Phycisphaerae bacterium]